MTMNNMFPDSAEYISDLDQVREALVDYNIDKDFANELPTNVVRFARKWCESVSPEIAQDEPSGGFQPATPWVHSRDVFCDQFTQSYTNYGELTRTLNQADAIDRVISAAIRSRTDELIAGYVQSLTLAEMDRQFAEKSAK